MNAQEFKAWFAGYTEGKDTLTAEQFKRVCDEVAQLIPLAVQPVQNPYIPGFLPYPAVSAGYRLAGG